MNDLMQKLALSKKIMEKHNQVPRGNSPGQPITENINTNYNIPDNVISQPPQVEQPRIQETFTTNEISKDAVLKSKLPEEIKKLMLDNPIVQPQMGGPSISDDIVEGAARLMNMNKGQESVIETKVNHQVSTDNGDLKQMIRDVVRDTVRDVIKEELQNSGLITESAKMANEVLSLRVGKHIFEGKVTKIKKIKQ